MSDNPRYAEMFDVNTQSANTGIDIAKDYTEDMNRLRDKARGPARFAAQAA